MNAPTTTPPPPAALPEPALFSVEVFDPPLCCPTGLCGPTPDQTLLDAHEMVLALQAQGITVARYQLASQPHLFLTRPEVMRLVRTQQLAALPITLVNGHLLKSGAYPTLAEVRAALAGGAP